MVKFTQLSSLEKVMITDYKYPKKEFLRMSVLKNETASYQIAYTQKLEEGIFRAPNVDFKVTVKSPLKKYITLRDVINIPSEYPAYLIPTDDDYISRKPGLYPDLLQPKQRQNVIAVSNQNFSLWVTLKLDGSVDAGVYPIDIIFKTAEGETEIKHVDVEIINACLPEQETIFTQWFHTDCIATAYKVKIFSKKHWDLIEKFIKTAVDNGINMLLTPLFTPPLDTQIGGERPTVQLVDVTVTEKGYEFGFEKLIRWINLCKKCGVKYFEMSHLFSQWGAKTAPKIVARVNGKLKKIFGWDTPGTGDEYKTFLNAFLPELKKVLKQEGIEKVTYFHISDEPHGEEQLANYVAAKEIVEPHLKGFVIMDALSQIDFYKTGAVKHPVPSTSTVCDFIDEKVPDLWTYYCCGTSKGLSNRYMCMYSYRNRAIGLQLYKFDIKGFLHWGYNFYYTQYSKERLNPFLITAAGSAFPSGDSFSVYPGDDGPWESLRLGVFYDALQDIRAFKLLESLIGKEKTVALIEEAAGQIVTFKDYPHSAEALLKVREKVNAKIKEFSE